jgi:hypothetical protein
VQVAIRFALVCLEHADASHSRCRALSMHAAQGCCLCQSWHLRTEMHSRSRKDLPGCHLPFDACCHKQVLRMYSAKHCELSTLCGAAHSATRAHS